MSELTGIACVCGEPESLHLYREKCECDRYRTFKCGGRATRPSESAPWNVFCPRRMFESSDGVSGLAKHGKGAK